MRTSAKMDKIKSQAEAVDRELSVAMGLPRGEQGTHRLIRGMMPPKPMMLWDLAVFWEGEVLATLDKFEGLLHGIPEHLRSTFDSILCAGLTESSGVRVRDDVDILSC